ncbi:MAG: ORF6N domain-containing protein [Bacteroidales bacterium]|nr:ORF6N domain-containing protein [Bacteroidales bacterium]
MEITNELLLPKIHFIRGTWVMIDRDLAELYSVETRRLNEQVKRNIERFPDDFMFQLTKEEESQYLYDSNLMSQFATSNWGGNRKLPYAFTENGIAMLSSVLRSEAAIEANIKIMRMFTSMRKTFRKESSLLNKIELLEFHQIETQKAVTDINNRLDYIFDKIETNDHLPAQGIFYDGQVYDAYTFVADLIRKAERRIVLIDNYIDDTVLTLLDKRKVGVAAIVHTSRMTKELELDIDKHNAQYRPIEINIFKRSHDRFLIIDDDVYLIGASIKDLGKKWFGFTLMESITPEDILER